MQYEKIKDVDINYQNAVNASKQAVDDLNLKKELNILMR